MIHTLPLLESEIVQNHERRSRLLDIIRVRGFAALDELVRELGVALTREIATHVYIAILTDTGSFHYSHISPRTFDICRQCMVAGIEPTPIARTLFDSNSLGRLKIFGAVLNDMRIDPSGRVATIVVDPAV